MTDRYQCSETHPLCTGTSYQWRLDFDDQAECSQHPTCPPCPPRSSRPPLWQVEKQQGAGPLVLGQGLAQALVGFSAPWSEKSV